MVCNHPFYALSALTCRIVKHIAGREEKCYIGVDHAWSISLLIFDVFCQSVLGITILHIDIQYLKAEAAVWLKLLFRCRAQAPKPCISNCLGDTLHLYSSRDKRYITDHTEQARRSLDHHVMLHVRACYQLSCREKLFPVRVFGADTSSYICLYHVQLETIQRCLVTLALGFQNSRQRF